MTHTDTIHVYKSAHTSKSFCNLEMHNPPLVFRDAPMLLSYCYYDKEKIHRLCKDCLSKAYKDIEAQINMLIATQKELENEKLELKEDQI